MMIAMAIAFASVLMFYYTINSRWSKRNREMRGLQSKSSEKSAENNGTTDRGAAVGGIDVIIVGAGVAGSALANTLGKASPVSFSLL